jgi:hypothetical protein
VPELTTLSAIVLACYNFGKFAYVNFGKLKGKAGEFAAIIDGLKLVIANAKK